jgi:hypothetical protein
MAKDKSLFGLWADMRVADINRLLRPHNVRLVAKSSKEWGDRVVITAQAIEAEPVAPQTPQPEHSAP